MKKSNKKKVKENPIMMDQKNIKGVKIKGDSGEQNEIKAFIILVVIIAVIIGVIYGLTELFKNDEKPKEEVATGTINYDIVSVGMILNRPYDEYYVLVYDSLDSKAVLYSTIMSKYMQNAESEDYIKLYYSDLNNELNSKYYDVNDDEISNPDATKVEEFDFGKLTLLKIEDGQISDYIEDLESIKEILK